MNNKVNTIIDIIGSVRAIVNEADRMRNAYFFQSTQSAGARRSYEKYHSHDSVEWTENGHTFTAKYTVTCRCSNVYAAGEYTKDGKRTTLTDIKNSLARMEKGV